MRKDPPYDLHYLQVLQILSQMERWESSRPTRYFRFLNHPIALMGLNEKLSLFDYPDMIHPSVAGFDLGAASSFFGAMAIPEMIMKPTHLFGGKGVFKFAPGQFDRDHLEASRDLHFYQEFDESIHDGEVRAFYAFGEPIAWCKKVPIKGQFLANTNHLSTREAYVPSKNLLSRLNPVAIDLAKKGAPIVGFDLIGEKITEINLTSPRLLYPENDPNKDQYFKSYAEKIRSEIN